MATRGRKPLATAEKIRRGNPGRRPLNDNEPEVKAVELKAPDHLDAEAKREWARVAPQLATARITCELDRALLASYCEAWSTYVQACKDVAENGAVLISLKTGQAYQGPWVNVRAMAEKQMRACMAELGMTPSSRSRIQAFPAEEEKGGNSRFFNTGLKVVG